jgi:tripartite-type tricarboxylate transporter receptor subunit TctC
VVVPYSAGSSTDILARKISEPLGRALGQSIVIENKAGANSTIGTEYVAKSPGDGYTLILGTNAGFAASPAGLVTNLHYDALADFVPVIHVASIYHMLVVKSSMPVNSAKELISLMKADPGKFNVASGNTASFAYGEMLRKLVGSDAVAVPYKSSPEAIIDLLGGRVQVMFTDAATGGPRIRAGQLKALAAAEKRNALLPDLPTLHELGVEGFGDASGWFAFYAPAGTPRAIVERLNREIAAILLEPQMHDWLLANGFTVATQTSPEALAAHTRSQIEYWKQIIRDYHLQPVALIEFAAHG